MAWMLSDRVTIYLAIESATLDGPALTQMLGRSPDREWRLGQPRGKTGKVWDKHGWVIEVTVRFEDSEEGPTFDLLRAALEQFESKVGPVRKSVASLGMLAERYVVISILAQELPGVELSTSLVGLLSDLQCSVQIDFQ